MVRAFFSVPWACGQSPHYRGGGLWRRIMKIENSSASGERSAPFLEWPKKFDMPRRMSGLSSYQHFAYAPLSRHPSGLLGAAQGGQTDAQLRTIGRAVSSSRLRRAAPEGKVQLRGHSTHARGYVSGVNSSSTPGVFYIYFCNHAHRPRLEKLLYIEPPRSSNGHFKPLLDPGGGFRIETAVTKPFRK
jgi:hypothetical protein